MGTGALYRLMDLWELGDVQGARAALGEYAERSIRSRVPGARAWIDIWTTTFLLFEGRLDEAEAMLMGWLADHRGVTEDIAMQSFGVQFFELRRSQGRCEEVEAAVRPLVEANPDVVAWRCGLAMLLAELDRRDEAGALFSDLARDDFAEVAAAPGSLVLDLALLTEVCAYLGDGGPRAEWLYGTLLPYAGRNIIVGAALASLGAASRYLGRLATAMERWDDAVAHFEEAMAMNERMGAKPWLARTACEYSEMLMRAGRRSTREPSDLLALAEMLADEIPMPQLARRVAAAKAALRPS